MTGLRSAVARDLDTLLTLHLDFFAEEGLPLREDRSRAGLRQLLADPGLGRVLVKEDGATMVGYLVLTFGFSVEFGGRDGLVDELSVVPGYRGHGLGSQALEAAAAACRERGIRAVHLVVDRSKRRVQSLYRRRGFVAHDRDVMTRRLD
jgi:ribosomal protein S18 acetylase RimI-like enzyme